MKKCLYKILINFNQGLKNSNQLLKTFREIFIRFHVGDVDKMKILIEFPCYFTGNYILIKTIDSIYTSFDEEQIKLILEDVSNCYILIIKFYLVDAFPDGYFVETNATYFFTPLLSLL